MVNIWKMLFRSRSAAGSVEAEPKPVRQASPVSAAGLRESEEHFGQLVSGLRDYAIFLLDREGHILTWNAGAERIKGYRPDEIIGQHFSRFYPAESRSSGWPEHELTVASATGRFEDEGWRIRKDGSRFWANVVLTALRDDPGEVRGFLKVTRDMTDRRQAEEKLRLSEERFRLLVEGVRDYALFMLDPQGYVATWNAGAQQAKGYTADEIIGQHFSIFYPQEAIDRHWPETELRRAAEEGRFEDEGWRVRKDGSQFWANVVITALRDDSGTLRGFAKVTRDMTDRRKAEENARRLLEEEVARRTAEANAAEARMLRDEERRQREQLHVTLSSIGDAVIVTDQEGKVTFLNPVAVTLTGWTLEEATSQPLETVFKIINEDSREKVENPVDKVFRENCIVGLANHTSVVARDGREVPIEDSAAPIRNDRGEIIGAVLVFRDVTAARRAWRDHRYLSAIVESSNDAIIGNDLEGKIISWNRGAERLYGYSEEEILGQSLSILVPPDHDDELPSIIHRLREGERIDQFETTRLRKDGGRVDVSLTVSPIVDEEGRVVGASKIARDITAMRRHQQTLRFLADVSRIMGQLLDVDSTLQKVANLAVPHVADWCAVHIADAQGEPQQVTVAHADHDKVHLAEELYRSYPPSAESSHGMRQVMRSGRSVLVAEVTEEMLRTIARDEQHLEILRQLKPRSYACVPLKTAQTVFGTMTFVFSESGRQYTAEDLAMVEDLAQRAGIALENARLYYKVREADRRKDEFLAMLSHELRNPLAPLRSGLEMLAMDPGEHQDTLKVMQEQVELVVRLVDDLLDVSRIMQGKIDLRKSPCEVAPLIHRTVDTIRALIAAREQQLHLSIPSEPIWISADPVRVVQILENLLNNASKYTDLGGRLELDVQMEGEQVSVTVTDNGVGIDPVLLPQVFELFTQSNRSLDRAQGGLGIGLTLVQRLVEMHHGTVTAHSEGEGHGSSFTVRLPRIMAPNNETQPTQAISAIQPRRILVVDDNVGAARLLAMLLEKLHNHVIEMAHDGPTALTKAHAFRPEIVLLDIGLPGMDGYQVGQRLRQSPELQDVLLVALTGYGRKEDRERSKEAGFDEHLVKPPSLEQIKGLLVHPKLTR